MGAPMPIVVVARWHMDPASVAEVRTLAQELRRSSLAEPGCLGYEVFHSPTEPGTLLLLERYRDAAAVAAHQASPHYQALVVARIRPLLTDRQVELLQAVPAADGAA